MVDKVWKYYRNNVKSEVKLFPFRFRRASLAFCILAGALLFMGSILFLLDETYRVYSLATLFLLLVDVRFLRFWWKKLDEKVEKAAWGKYGVRNEGWGVVRSVQVFLLEKFLKEEGASSLTSLNLWSQAIATRRQSVNPSRSWEAGFFIPFMIAMWATLGPALIHPLREPAQIVKAYFFLGLLGFTALIFVKLIREGIQEWSSSYFNDLSEIEALTGEVALRYVKRDKRRRGGSKLKGLAGK